MAVAALAPPVLREWRCPACPSAGHAPKLLARYAPVEGLVLIQKCPKCGAVVTLTHERLK